MALKLVSELWSTEEEGLKEWSRSLGKWERQEQHSEGGRKRWVEDKCPVLSWSWKPLAGSGSKNRKKMAPHIGRKFEW